MLECMLLGPILIGLVVILCMKVVKSKRRKRDKRGSGIEYWM